MPLLPSQPRQFSDQGYGDHDNLQPGVYLAVLTEWKGPQITQKGSLYYICTFEEVVPSGKGGRATYWIQCDSRGLPTLTYLGEGKWQNLLKCWGLIGKGALDTDTLLFRPAKITVRKSKGGMVSISDAAEATAEDQQNALDYVNREYPLAE